MQGLADGLKEGSRAILTICAMGATDNRTREQGKRALKQSNVNWVAVGANLIFGGARGWVSTGVELASMAATGNTQADKYRSEDQKVVEAKPLLKSLWDMFIVLQVDAVDQTDLANATNSGLAIVNNYKTDYNWFDLPNGYKAEAVWVQSAADEQRTSALGLIKQINSNAWQKEKFRSVLCAHEVATLFHLPHSDFQTPTIAWRDTARPSDAILNNTDGVVIGKYREAEIHLPDEDRKTHVNIIGKNGTGKSTLMHNLIHRDIAAGKGVYVIDPHGTLIKDIVRGSIPDERMDDVVIIDVADEAYPPPLNPLAIPDESGSIAVGQVTAIIDKMYGEPSAATRWTNVMQAALSTLRFEQTPTVRDVTKLFTDTEYRLSLLNQHREDLDEVSYEFWEKYNAMTSEARKDELNYPVVHRMQSFYSSPTLYPIMCHPDTLDWRKLLASNKIILVSLKSDEAKIPEREQYLLGAVCAS
ncbi:MAG: ATP-binding protein [Anaerolineae bacterium]|nr:ATP-binding protein [Anaerolineae bacterium]